MSWLKNNAFINNANKQCSYNILTNNTDRGACYDSFCKHWQQAHEIIKQSFLATNESFHDDLVAFINHIDQMVTLLLIEFRNNTTINNCHLTVQTNLLCLEYLLSENLLDIVYDWSTVTQSSNTVDSKLMKLFGLLISSNTSILVHEPVLRPLLKLLKSIENKISSPDVEAELIYMLYSICVALNQNPDLLNIFFCSTDSAKRKFLPLSLLLPFVHREGILGQQARDATLLYMSLSQNNHEMAVYLSENSNVCPILATGISGLYSLLPQKLCFPNKDLCRLTAENICSIPSLNHLIHYSEFCNAVAMLSHSFVQKKLSEYLYHGFLDSVLGPALLQTSLDEAVTATVYLELFLRKVTNPGLLYTVIKFLLEPNNDGYKILDVLIQRISSNSQLCIVTLALIETLVDLNNEDIMLELCFSSLSPCSHVMLSQRCKLQDFDFFGNAAKKILSLRPICCSALTNFLEKKFESVNYNKSLQSNESLLPSTLSFGYRLHESLCNNYSTYLFNARTQIILCRLACSSWSSQYDGQNDTINNEEAETKTDYFYNVEDSHTSDCDIIENVKSFIDDSCLSYNDYYDQENLINNIDNKLIPINKNEENPEVERLHPSLDIIYINNHTWVDNTPMKKVNGKSSKNNSSKLFIDHAGNNETLYMQNSLIQSNLIDAQCKKQLQSLESIKNENQNSNINYSLMICNMPVNTENTNSKPSIGKFLDAMFRKLEYMTSNDLHVNLRLTGLISRLAIYQQPVLQSFLLNPTLIFQPSIRSLFQILASLKHKIDQYLAKIDNIEELIYKARCILKSLGLQVLNDKVHDSVMVSGQNLSIHERNSSTHSLEKYQTKRRSLTSQLTQMLKLGVNGMLQLPKLNPTTHSTDNGNKPFQSYSESTMSTISSTEHIVLCAVILDEWLKELSAITQEHCILSRNISE